MKPDNGKGRVYKILILITLCVCIVLFVLLFVFQKSNFKVALISAFISILGGAFSSVIVTWFIDRGNAKNDAKNKRILHQQIMLTTYNTIIVFLLNFVRLSVNVSPEKQTDKHFIKEWLDFFIISLAEPANKEECKNALVSLFASCNNVHNRLEEIKINHLHLFVNELIDNEEYYALRNLDFIIGQISSHAKVTLNGYSEVKLLINKLIELRDSIESIIKIIPRDYYDLHKEISGDSFRDFLMRTDGKTYVLYTNA